MLRPHGNCDLCAMVQARAGCLGRDGFDMMRDSCAQRGRPLYYCVRLLLATYQLKYSTTGPRHTRAPIIYSFCVIKVVSHGFRVFEIFSLNFIEQP